MKKVVILFAAAWLFVGADVAAQQNVGIGTNTPDVSARLDISATNKGLLVPRVNLTSTTDATTITTPATGLLIYNTNAAVTGGTGFYYNNGSSAAPAWVKLQTGSGGSSSGWALTGNAGTDSTTNFVGTTDAKPLVFAVNNGYAGQLGSGGGIALGRGANGFARVSSPGIIAIGDSALYNNTGAEIIAIGNGALYSNTIGINNVATGTLSMVSNTDGFSNVAYGDYTLSALDTGDYNTAVGYGALNGSQTDFNTSVGAFSLSSNLFGDENTAVGFQALTSNQFGFDNTTVGFNSLVNNTDGFYNTSMGVQSMFSNNIGSRNTAIGFNAMALNTSGTINVAVGRAALFNNDSGNGNTAIGNRALNNLTTGNFNTAIGDSADVLSGGLFNTTSIGFQAVTTASNTISIGNTAITAIRGQVGFSTFSDGRYKKDVNEDVKGLAFIMQLRPVSYHYDFDKIRAERHQQLGDNFAAEDAVKSFTAVSLKNAPAQNKHLVTAAKQRMQASAKAGISPQLQAYYQDVKQNDGIRYTGFIAQEVEAAAKKSGFDFSGVDKPKNDTDQYALRYAEFVVPLVKAVQEQQAIIDAQNKKIQQLTERIEKLEQ
jgi:trimeric autotransporter adhesin